MTPEQQRIAIAEACGWKIGEESITSPSGEYTDCEFLAEEFVDHLWPNYQNDLNDMHEAEGKLTNMQLRDYCMWIVEITREGTYMPKLYEEMYYPIHATASQRAEAFLRAIGKWEDGE